MFPLSEMVSTSSVTDKRTPLVRLISTLSSQTSRQFQQLPVYIIQRVITLCIPYYSVLLIIIYKYIYFCYAPNFPFYSVDLKKNPCMPPYTLEYPCIPPFSLLYHAIENVANQNAGKQLYIRQYSTKPSHQSV